MIKRLRIKFIALSMLAVLVLLAAIVAAMNFINYNTIISEADSVLAVLSENKGSFPQFAGKEGIHPGPDSWPEDSDSDIFKSSQDGESSSSDENESESQTEDYTSEQGYMKREKDWMRGMSPETPYESRFFSVLIDSEGTVKKTDISRIASVDETSAEEYAVEIFNTGRTKGIIETYRYVVKEEDGFRRITFLDWGRKLESFSNFRLISILMGAAGYILFFIVIFFFSKKIMRPVAESYEKQKRFITDAGHEIKTPLTIIKADADILEMDMGENEWIDDIQKQTERLASLTNDLIYLARTEEADDTTQMIEFPLSDLIEEITDSFRGPAVTQNKKYETDIEPMISMTGDEKKIGQLVGILIDNALKYSPEEGNVSVSLKKAGKDIVFTVYNTTSDPVEKEQLPKMFDRFYRMDSSRNSRTGGYGIGLSMAKAITEAHGGKINAKTDDGKSLKMIVTF